MKPRILSRIFPGNTKTWIKGKIRSRLLRPLINASGVDLIELAYQRAGILNFADDHATGERFVVNQLLPILLKDRPVLFDVGANVGKYTRALCEQFPNASIFSFEPMVDVYQQLADSVKSLNATCINLGLSDQETAAMIYTYGAGGPTSHTTLFADVISQLHHADTVKGIDIKLTTADAFAEAHGIDRIDFLKIDTEGNEFRVLQGATKLLQRRALAVIQFEFNEMNVMSRVYLRDFYQALKTHDFYRLMPDGLLPLGEYRPRNEIFAFQNILAVDREQHPRSLMSRFDQYTIV